MSKFQLSQTKITKQEFLEIKDQLIKYGYTPHNKDINKSLKRFDPLYSAYLVLYNHGIFNILSFDNKTPALSLEDLKHHIGIKSEKKYNPFYVQGTKAEMNSVWNAWLQSGGCDNISDEKYTASAYRGGLEFYDCGSLQSVYDSDREYRELTVSEALKELGASNNLDTNELSPSQTHWSSLAVKTVIDILVVGSTIYGLLWI